ncbi:MAG: Tad domain-containing protein [Actinobacteria bacterium]|jgi:Flp pilus assembly protein TadG|nr:Tad domain-containing protein [Actinomycetota bacterium]
MRGRLIQIRESRGADAGAVAVLVAVLVPAFLMFAALAVDVARWYVEGERLQKAADAASLAGVVFMPQDFATAQSTALAIAADNGYAPSSKVTIVVQPGSKQSQLRVTIKSTVSNAFGSFAGFKTTDIERTSVADYVGPAPMGSPCNTFGNQPAGGVGQVGSAIPASPVNSKCIRNPTFWANIEGPQTTKVQGDQFMNRVCAGGESQCSGTQNDDFPNGVQGYFFLVDVKAGAGNVDLQLYDPAWIYTGVDCSALPSSWPSNNMNSYVNDAQTRYADNNNAAGSGLPTFCTGDYAPGRSDTGVRVDTSFALREAPTPDTGDPTDSTVVPGCIKQYKGSTTAPGVTQLQQYRTAGNSGSGANSAYVDELAQVFHRWTSLCTITSPGRYYLQVRTNVALPSMSATQFIASGNNNVVSQTGDNTSMNGSGSNAFAIRGVAATDGTKVAISGYERMPTDINTGSVSGSVFNLIRVIPAAQGKQLRFQFFDAADGTGSSGGTITVQRPADATGSITSGSGIAGCVGSGVVNGSLTNCSVRVNSSNNGKLQTITIPIPADYSCNSTSAGGCWFTVQINYAQATDVMTWNARITGDPVRIVE